MIDAVLGIDIGASGVRIAATARDNKVLATSAAPIMAPLQSGGRILQDPAIWWAAVQAAFRTLDLSGVSVRAIAIDGTSGTILGVDANGRPAGLAAMYNDVADRAQLALVASAAPRETAALVSTSPLARAMAMRSDGTHIIHQADWIVGQLSGTYDVTDENNALKSGYDPVSQQWPAWIVKAGFDPSLFPRVVPAGTPIAKIKPEIAGNFGLPADVALVAGTTGGCAAFLASGASDPGDGVTSLGTTLTLKLLSAHPVFAPDFGIYSHRIGEQWLAGGASNSGGGAIANFFSNDDLARLTPLLGPNHPTGLDYYPLPKHGERFPTNDPFFAPRFDPRPADDRMFLQEILEGIAHIEAEAYAKLAELGAAKLVSIRTTGGGASNAVWTKIRLRALGVPERPSLSEHAAIGTARLAWRGLGYAN